MREHRVIISLELCGSEKNLWDNSVCSDRLKRIIIILVITSNLLCSHWTFSVYNFYLF